VAPVDDFTAELQEIFLVEASENIEKSEAAFLALEKGDFERIDEIFRLAHNFKGSAKGVGFEQLSSFAHKVEDVLLAIKSGSLRPGKQVVTVLLKALDALKSFVAGLKKDASFVLLTSELESELALLASQKPGSTLLIEAPAEPLGDILVQDHGVARERVDEALAAQKKPLGEILVEKGVATHDQVDRALKQQSVRSGSLVKEEYIRVSMQRLDDLINVIGELVTQQAILKKCTERLVDEDPILRSSLRYLDKIISDSQSIGMSLRMLPVKTLFQKMQRIVRDVGSAQGKDIEFSFEGDHVELDRLVVDRMSDPLTHLLRNAVDHGIERPELRKSRGKNPKGSIHLSAEQHEGEVTITVKDDGGGINPERVLKEAREKGLISDSKTLSQEDIFQLIFLPGFSTRDQVSDVSGRGVGMDVVKSTVDDLKGRIQIQSNLGQGSTFVITLPLSLSIVEGMLVGIGGEPFVVPISQIQETLQLKKLKTEGEGKARVLHLRQEVIPIRDAAELLGLTPTHSEDAVGFVVASGVGKVCLFADEVLGQQSVVIKPLPQRFDVGRGIIGASVLGSGQISLILSLSALSEVSL
jgi:two-component system chemotaxis sensor kinase CheA